MSHSGPGQARNVALITGAARRIGRKIAETLAEAGFDVALHTSARSQPDAETLAAQLRKAGKRAMSVVADLANAAEVAKIMPEVAAQLGPVTLLVNNASLFEPDHARNFAAASFDVHMAVNLRAPLILASAFAAQLPAAASGNIVNIIDQRVWRLNPTNFSYTLSKSALWTATQTMAQAFAPCIRVNAIGPGPTVQNVRQDGAAFAREAAATLLGHAVGDAAIAQTVLYFLAAHHVTGQMIAVDSGQHLAWETPDVQA